MPDRQLDEFVREEQPEVSRRLPSLAVALERWNSEVRHAAHNHFDNVNAVYRKLSSSF